MFRLTTAASQTAQTDNITRFNVAKVERYFFLFSSHIGQPFHIVLRLLEVFNVITCVSFYCSTSKWYGPKGLHADIGSLKRFRCNMHIAS
jgi:hypothetical protein